MYMNPMQLSYHLCHHIIYGYQFASYHVDTEMVICDTYQWDEKHIPPIFPFHLHQDSEWISESDYVL